MNAAEKVVRVTGASGFIASWLVKLLLQRGYTVRATVRDPNDPKKTEHLLSLDGAKERLHLFKAELLDEGCFDSIVDGCRGVFHTASPVIVSATDPQAEIIDPAVKGTLNVLKSCVKVPSIKRVVLTASTSSLLYNGKPLTPDVVADETWFSDSPEEAAWRFAKDNRIELVVLNPGFVIGPLLQPALNTTSEWVLALTRGENTFPATFRFVDVRDVAYAHIQAFEIPPATGRYCLVERNVQS
ncbi:hypothetical protein V6N11_078054 [Hibiscus sabdariffa]|uniref:NAD-dependent epimerase/dehydratase domain-containing protein n=1 Tax=Hibiscus sabdariffa TaxID=183260 RepID=A0ABR2TEZ4_9ROSI